MSLFLASVTFSLCIKIPEEGKRREGRRTNLGPCMDRCQSAVSGLKCFVSMLMLCITEGKPWRTKAVHLVASKEEERKRREKRGKGDEREIRGEQDRVHPGALPGASS